MANTTKRKSAPKRKPAAKRLSGVALSGWLVAAGLGAVLMGPQAGLWWDQIVFKFPSLDELRAMAHRPDSRSPKDEDARQQKMASRSDDAGPSQTPQKRPVLPVVAPDVIAEIVRKTGTKPGTPLAAPQPRVPVSRDDQPSRTGSALTPPVPGASIPFMTAAIRKEPQTRPPTARPGELAIRRYPFTTAPAVAYVGDLRTLRIIGGEGDWKKVEVSATGVVGWLRLQRIGAGSAGRTSGTTASTSRSAAPAAPLLREADAAGSR